MEKSNRSRLEHDIVELELERVKYMLKAYLRIRKLKVPLFSLTQIERNIFYIIREDLCTPLSESEFNYAIK